MQRAYEGLGDPGGVCLLPFGHECGHCIPEVAELVLDEGRERRGNSGLSEDLGDQPGVVLIARQGAGVFEELMDGRGGELRRECLARLVADGGDDLVLAGEVAVDRAVG